MESLTLLCVCEREEEGEPDPKGVAPMVVCLLGRPRHGRSCTKAWHPASGWIRRASHMMDEVTEWRQIVGRGTSQITPWRSRGYRPLDMPYRTACVGGPAHLAASRLGAAGYVDLPRPAAAIVSCPQQFAHASSKRRERRLVASLPRRLSRLNCPCRARLQNTVKRCPQEAWRLRLADWTTESHVGASLSDALPSTAPSSRICDKSPRRIA